MTRAVYLDTSVAVYAVGGEHPMRQPCRAVFQAAADGELSLHASIEVLQEFCFHRMRRAGAAAAVADTRALMAALTIHEFDLDVLERSLDLMGSTSVRGRDAVHAATALARRIVDVVSTDLAFDGVPGLRRLDPTDLRAD